MPMVHVKNIEWDDVADNGFSIPAHQLPKTEVTDLDVDTDFHPDDANFPEAVCIALSNEFDFCVYNYDLVSVTFYEHEKEEGYYDE